MDQDRECSKIAGNTISVPVVGSLTAAVLASTKPKVNPLAVDGWPVPSGAKAPPMPPLGVWIGEQRVADTACKWDIVFPKSSPADPKPAKRGLKRPASSQLRKMKRPASSQQRKLQF